MVKSSNTQGGLSFQLSGNASSDLAHREHVLGLAYCLRNALSRMLILTAVYAIIRSSLSSQLRKMRANDGDSSNHVFVSIVRLTVETNLVTSKDPDL
jgi:hypothetical protein